MKPMTHNLLRREWLQYKSFGRTWLWIWVLYLGMYLLLGVAAGFVVVFLPIIMAYSAIYSAKQTGEAVNAGHRGLPAAGSPPGRALGQVPVRLSDGFRQCGRGSGCCAVSDPPQPRGSHQPLLCAGCHHDLHRSHHRSRHAAALPVRRHQGTPHPAGAHGNFSRSGRQYGSGGPGCSGRRARWSPAMP